MEHPEIHTRNFERWLTTLGYAQSTISQSTCYVKDFFFYLNENKIDNIEEIKQEIITAYYEYLQKRRKRRSTGGLSENTIAGNINALKRFSRYLQESGSPTFEITVKITIDKNTGKTILSREEIRQLYKACSNDIYGLRDRAILSIYYGCGLRRNEGAALDVKDILLKEKLVYVRSGKGNKERYVPMTEAVREDMENYLYQSRDLLNSLKPKEEAFFVSYRATRMSGNAIQMRLSTLIEKARIEKKATLHTLRHTIATHLLQSGLTLEEVSQFLGHSSLESTQIYTHIANEIICQ